MASKGNSRSKGPDQASRRLAAERAAQARQRIAEDQRRRRLITVAGAVGAIIVIVAVLIVVKVASGSSGPKSGTKATTADASISQALSAVPASALDAVGVGTSTSKTAPQTTSGAALTADGLPRVLYVGAEWCPYCAAERWAVAVALDRFGTFQGLGTVSSSPSDVYPNTATLTFHGATYTSKYLAFTGKELQTNQVSNGTYTDLDSISGNDQTLFEKLGGGSYPFVDLGGTSYLRGAQYDPGVLQGMTQQQIAQALSNPGSTAAKNILGAANVLTADLCRLTKGAPTAVCTSSGVTAAAAVLPSAG